MSRHEWAWLGSMIGKFRDQKAALGIYRLLPNVTDIRADLDARYGDLPMIQHLPIPTPKGHPDLDGPTLTELARLGRKCWGRAKWLGGRAELGPEVYEGLREEIDLVRLHFAIDLARFDGIADDIHPWAEARR